jgi:glycine/D-amino acid oxidase-like deaminating enzyme/nitrite reductase/ring-hydroxylating ferredoxin subunit
VLEVSIGCYGGYGESCGTFLGALKGVCNVATDRSLLPGQDSSLWLATTPRTEYLPLQPGLTVDVAVIGGGLAGLTAATLLKEAGKSVAVLEAGRIVTGVTGNTTAKLTALHGLIYDYLIHHFGRPKAQAYADANQAAISFVEETARRRGIECDFARTEAYTCGGTADQTEAVRKEVDAALALGLPASFVESTELPFSVPAAVRLENQARFHPRKYLLGLASTLTGEGSYLFENTRVLEVNDGDPPEVVTDQGALHARTVIVASHYPVIDRGFYFARLTSERSYVLALKIDGEVPNGMYLSEEPYYSVRSHPGADGEPLLLVGGEKHKTGEGGDTVARYQRVEAWARERFPVRSVEYRWSTQDNWTLDRVPYIGKAAPSTDHIYVATGFGGWGMTGATVAGILLRDLVQGYENSWAEVYDPNRFNLDSAAHLAGTGAGMVANFLGGRFRRTSHEPPAPGEGKIAETDDGKVALYCDEAGTLHQLSPTCTHMGCFVNWNPAERSWDCPCHGSRFSAEGRVIHGPAVKDLEKA